jgi:hypothetical protein
VPYLFYRAIHFLGIFGLVVVLAVALARTPLVAPDPWRKRLARLHGGALFLILLGGFGMLARLGVDHGAIFPGWVWVKLAIWTTLGGLVLAAGRSAVWSIRGLVLIPLLAALAGLVAYAKPFG